MKINDLVVRNPNVILREEFDNWALLFDPDNNKIFVIDPISVFIWKNLDGKQKPKDILGKLQGVCEDIPKDAIKQIEEFIEELVKEGLAGFQIYQNEINE